MNRLEDGWRLPPSLGRVRLRRSTTRSTQRHPHPGQHSGQRRPWFLTRLRHGRHIVTTTLQSVGMVTGVYFETRVSRALSPVPEG
jgi:hypothetical protein